MIKITKKVPKILLLDIETAPIVAYVWDLWDQNVGLNQIKSDWHLLSWAAKWLDEEPVMYMDQRCQKKLSNDKFILNYIWKLLDSADYVIMQNGKKFDKRKLNARFILNGMQPPSPYKVIDTLLIAKRHFNFTSNKLEYLSDKLSNIKKMTKRKFAGFDLWAECLKNNPKAWNELEKYNKLDVLALEQVYKKLIPWDNQINFSIHTGRHDDCGVCNSKHSLIRSGYSILSSGAKRQRYKCTACGAWSTDKKNLVNSSEMKKVKTNIKG